MLSLLWQSKHRSGVAANLTMDEWEARLTEGNATVVTVSKHKTRDKQPVSIVMVEEMANHMHR